MPLGTQHCLQISESARELRDLRNRLRICGDRKSSVEEVSLAEISLVCHDSK